MCACVTVTHPNTRAGTRTHTHTHISCAYGTADLPAFICSENMQSNPPPHTYSGPCERDKRGREREGERAGESERAIELDGEKEREHERGGKLS